MERKKITEGRMKRILVALLYEKNLFCFFSDTKKQSVQKSG